MKKEKQYKHYKMEEAEKVKIKLKAKSFYFMYSLERLELMFTPNEHISDRFSLEILFRYWFSAMIRRRRQIIGTFNEGIISPFLDLNRLFDKKKARKETLKRYIRNITIFVLHVIYLSILITYDVMVHEKVMYEWFFEYGSRMYN